MRVKVEKNLSKDFIQFEPQNKANIDSLTALMLDLTT